MDDTAAVPRELEESEGTKKRKIKVPGEQASASAGKSRKARKSGGSKRTT
jgi:hypothetical protein